ARRGPAQRGGRGGLHPVTKRLNSTAGIFVQSLSGAKPKTANASSAVFAAEGPRVAGRARSPPSGDEETELNGWDFCSVSERSEAEDGKRFISRLRRGGAPRSGEGAEPSIR